MTRTQTPGPGLTPGPNGTMLETLLYELPSIVDEQLKDLACTPEMQQRILYRCLNSAPEPAKKSPFARFASSAAAKAVAGAAVVLLAAGGIALSGTSGTSGPLLNSAPLTQETAGETQESGAAVGESSPMLDEALPEEALPDGALSDGALPDALESPTPEAGAPETEPPKNGLPAGEPNGTGDAPLVGSLQSGAPEDEENAVDEGSTEKDFPEEALPEESVEEGVVEDVVEGAEEGPWDESGAVGDAPPAGVPEDEFETPEEDPEEVFPEQDVPDGTQEGSGGLPESDALPPSDGAQEDSPTTGSESAEETVDPPTDGLKPPDSLDGAPTGGSANDDASNDAGDDAGEAHAAELARLAALSNDLATVTVLSTGAHAVSTQTGEVLLDADTLYQEAAMTPGGMGVTNGEWFVYAVAEVQVQSSLTGASAGTLSLILPNGLSLEPGLTVHLLVGDSPSLQAGGFTLSLPESSAVSWVSAEDYDALAALLTG